MDENKNTIPLQNQRFAAIKDRLQVTDPVMYGYLNISASAYRCKRVGDTDLKASEILRLRELGIDPLYILGLKGSMFLKKDGWLTARETLGVPSK